MRARDDSALPGNLLQSQMAGRGLERSPASPLESKAPGDSYQLSRGLARPMESNMRKVTRWTICTVQRNDGSFCNRPSLPRAPYPMCLKHATRVYEWVKYEVREADFDHVGAELIAHMLHGDTAPRTAMQVMRGVEVTQVYYARVRDLIKIGSSSDVERRISDYIPGSHLLAVEPGGIEVERQRQAQFRSSRALGREWFQPSSDLIEHINSLRDEPLTAADLAA